MELPEPSAELRDRLLAAYRPQVSRRLAAVGLAAPPGLEEALAAGEAWLRETLDALLEAPFIEQRRGPLEVFQEAMRFPTAALEAAGVPPLARDDVAQAALPGDHYQLAPASSRELGEETWRAHIAWGAAKAKAVAPQVRPPQVAVVTANLLDRTRIESAVTAAGFDPVLWSEAGAVAEGLGSRKPVLALVDLELDEADAVIRGLAEAGVRTVAFGPHVDDLALARARSLGAADALPRSRFFQRLPDLFPTVA